MKNSIINTGTSSGIGEGLCCELPGSKLRYTTDFQTRAAFCLRKLIPSGAFQWVMRKSTEI